MSKSSFSISTLTVRLVAGFPAPAFLAGAAALFSGCLAGCAAVGLVSAAAVSSLAGAATVSAGAVGSSPSTLNEVSSPQITLSTSDTFSAAFLIFSISSADETRKLKSNSNFSSSISCELGLYTTMSEKSSTALNTKNALAALSRHSCCT